MDIYTAQEVAYKNGYEAGVKEFAARLKEYFLLNLAEKISVITADDVDKLKKELTKNDAEG